MIKIDYQKCNGCLNCVKKCICAMIEAVDGRPVLFPERGCIRCMHCAASCKEKAITYNDEEMALEESFTATKDFAQNLKAFLKSRRSYRNYSDKPVDIEIIREALEVAAWAPSAKNQHPTKYYVINNKKTLDDITDIVLSYIRKTGDRPEILEGAERGLNMIFGNATTAILAYGRNNAVNATADTILALNYAELVLQSRGIGTCWSGYFTHFANTIPELGELFPLPKNNKFYGSLLLGYPNEEYYFVPQRIKQADITIK